MANYTVKLQRHGGQYRVTIPAELIEECGFEGVELVNLEKIRGFGILIEEYCGKRKEKRDLPEDQS